MDYQEKNHVLVLCYLDENRMDIGGNIYPKDGFISAKKFTNDENVEFGLYGIIWGKTNKLFYEKINSNNWTIVKVRIDNNFIIVDNFNNRVKFKNGMIICSGNVKLLSIFLWKNKDYLSQYNYKYIKDIKKRDIVGTNKWMKINMNKETIC